MSDHDTRWLDTAVPADAALDELLAAGRAERPSAAQLQALADRLASTFNEPGGGGGGGSGGGGEPGRIAPASAPTSIAPATPIAPAALAFAAAAILALLGVWAFHSGRADDAGTSAPTSLRAASAAPSPRPVATEAPIETSAELALLEQAHRALASAPTHALASIAAHERRFPASQYAQERELMAIEALLALNQIERARVHGERFLAQYPRSSHGRKVRSLIAAPRVAAARDAGAAVP